MELVVSDKVVRCVQSRGGALYVWARKARCCGAFVTLDVSTAAPEGRMFREALTGDVDVFLAVGLPEPSSLHVEVSRRGRLRAFWDGLAWVAT
jgi:hypothetical protein